MSSLATFVEHDSLGGSIKSIMRRLDRSTTSLVEFLTICCPFSIIVALRATVASPLYDLSKVILEDKRQERERNLHETGRSPYSAGHDTIV